MVRLFDVLNWVESHSKLAGNAPFDWPLELNVLLKWIFGFNSSNDLNFGEDGPFVKLTGLEFLDQGSSFIANLCQFHFGKVCGGMIAFVVSGYLIATVLVNLFEQNFLSFIESG